MPLPIARAVRVTLESLETRQHLAAQPYHLTLAQRSVDEIVPADNSYSNTNTLVTWKGINGATKTFNRSDCTTYVTRLLKTAYGFTDNHFKAWTTVSSPATQRYYDAAIANRGFEAFLDIDDVKPGDMWVSKYVYEGASANGHMGIIETAPVLARVSATQRFYNVQMIDCTGAIHTSDSRNVVDPTDPTSSVNPNTGQKHDTGIGRGKFRLVTDLEGNLQSWAWGGNDTWIVYEPEDRPITFAKMPPTVESATFSASPWQPTVTLNFRNEIDPATLRPADLVVTNTTTGQAFTPVSTTMNFARTQVTFSLPATLTDGSYKFEMENWDPRPPTATNPNPWFNTAPLTTSEGNLLAAGVTLQTAETFILSGDTDRDRDVDFDDLLTLTQNFGTTGRSIAQGNVDRSDDGSVNFDDLLLMSQQYGKTLLSAAPLVAQSSTTTMTKRRSAAV